MYVYIYMCVCMCIYIYIYIYVCVCVCGWVYECIYICVWLCIYVCKCIHISLCVCIYVCICAYLCIYIYEVHTISFQTFFVFVFKIVIDSWKFSILLLYIFWDDWPIFMISGSNEQLQQQLKYTLLKPDFHSWWILRF